VAELADAADSKADTVKDEYVTSRNHWGESSVIEPSEAQNGQCRAINSGLDAIELALSEALSEATRAQRWDVVAQLADELRARRLAKSANVISIEGARRNGGEP
jgi:hypothetical protein